MKESRKTPAAEGNGEPAKGSPSVPCSEEKSDLDPGAVRKGKGRADTERGSGKSKQKSASVHIKDEDRKEVTDLEGSIHQRSRSNEIDYVSLRSDAGKGATVSAFRSPPGSMQTFRPLLSGGATSPKEDGSHTMVSFPNNEPDTVAASDATVSTEGGLEGAAVEGDLTEEVRTERFSWLKDFDSSLWSNYFTDNPRYSDC